jgi:hypothetical protein
VGAVIGGLTILQLVQIVSALAAAGKSTTDLVDWIKKRQMEGVRDSQTLLPQHEYDATKLIAQSLDSNTDTAYGFVNGVLGR